MSVGTSIVIGTVFAVVGGGLAWIAYDLSRPPPRKKNPSFADLEAEVPSDVRRNMRQISRSTYRGHSRQEQSYRSQVRGYVGA